MIFVPWSKIKTKMGNVGGSMSAGGYAGGAAAYNDHHRPRSMGEHIARGAVASSGPGGLAAEVIAETAEMSGHAARDHYNATYEFYVNQGVDPYTAADMAYENSTPPN